MERAERAEWAEWVEWVEWAEWVAVRGRALCGTADNRVGTQTAQRGPIIAPTMRHESGVCPLGVLDRTVGVGNRQILHPQQIRVT